MRNYFIDEDSAYAAMNKVDYYLCKTGWPVSISSLTLEPYGDGTYSIAFIKDNGELDLVPDRVLKLSNNY